MRLQARLAQELPLHTQSQDLGHCSCDGNRGDLRPLQNSQSDPTTTATAAAGRTGQLTQTAAMGSAQQDPARSWHNTRHSIGTGSSQIATPAGRFLQQLVAPRAQYTLVLAFLELGCKLLAQNSPGPSLSTSSHSPRGRDHRGQGESAADHPRAMCDLQAQPSPPTYLVHSLKSSLEGSCSSLSQQASTSCEGTSGTWSSLWGQREGVRHREQSTRILL